MESFFLQLITEMVTIQMKGLGKIKLNYENCVVFVTGLVQCIYKHFNLHLIAVLVKLF